MEVSGQLLKTIKIYLILSINILEARGGGIIDPANFSVSWDKQIPEQ
jgi:hypothetical protein